VRTTRELEAAAERNRRAAYRLVAQLLEEKLKGEVLLELGVDVALELHRIRDAMAAAAEVPPLSINQPEGDA